MQKKISIPGKLFKSLEKELLNSSFASIDDLAVYILQRYLQQKEEPAGQSAEDEIEKRLKNLGYI